MGRLMNVPATLRRARRAASLTQAELADRAGVPQSTIGRIESGQAVPRVDMLSRLLALCGWDLRAEAAPRAADADAPAIDEHHPYFLWDTPMTLAEFRAALHGDDPARRAWALGRLLSQAHWDDIWALVTVDDLARDLPRVRMRNRRAWELLVEHAHPSHAA